MNTELFVWSQAVSAIPRILMYQEDLRGRSFFDQMQLFSKVFGPDYIFRLNELVGTERIRQNRPSWANFYVDDIYGMHIPLDPRAPETLEFLGKETATKELAFYTGMGFDGYLLALNTKRLVHRDNLSIEFGDYKLDWLQHTNTMSSQKVFEPDSSISKETYYRIYGEALLALFSNFSQIANAPRIEDIDERLIENTAGASLLFLCGGHKGCKAHISQAERTETQLEAIIISLYTTSLARMETTFESLRNSSKKVVQLQRLKA